MKSRFEAMERDKVGGQDFDEYFPTRRQLVSFYIWYPGPPALPLCLALHLDWSIAI